MSFSSFFSDLISSVYSGSDSGVIKSSELGWQTFATFLTVVSIGIFAYAFWPMLLSTMKTKDTSAINMKMFSLHFGAALFFGLGAATGFISAISGGLPWSLVVINLFFAFHNLSVAGGLFKVLVMKKRHMNDAMNLGISEFEHYKLYVLPEVERQKNPTGEVVK